MTLDIPTLFVVATCITGLLGACLLFAWVRDRSVRALAWWGAAYLIGGSAVALWSVDPSFYMPPGTPSAMLFLSCGLIWSGARLFHGRQVRPFALAAGAAIWLAIRGLTDLAASDESRVILSSLIIATYTFLTAIELRIERRQGWKMPLVLPLLHASVFLLPILLIVLSSGQAGFSGGWFAIFALQTLLYAVGTAFVVVIMAKERSELIHKTAASTDPLTGLFNRRAFLERAQRIIAKASTRGESVSVMMFDLDHFKSINDRFGHAAGDDALCAFATTVIAHMRVDDLVARFGGEEFVAMVPGGETVATTIAERVRTAFEAAGVDISGYRMDATVSIGAACELASTANIQRLLTQADAALYRAKSNGRNRLEIARDETRTPERSPPLVPASGLAACVEG